MPISSDEDITKYLNTNYISVLICVFDHLSRVHILGEFYVFSDRYYFLDLFLKTDVLTLAVKVTNVLLFNYWSLPAQGLTSAGKETICLST